MTKVVDPFIDEQFAPLDTRTGPSHIADVTEPQDITPAASQPTQPTIEPDDSTQSETIDIEGGTVTLEYDKKKGWTGILSLDEGGGDEVFYGKTQKELMTKVLAGKAKATAQIRKLNRKIKLGIRVDEPVVVQEPAINQPNQLSADDVFQIKTALEADPDKAFELWFQKKFGLTGAQLVQIAQSADARSKKGEEAYEELTIEGVSNEFLNNHKEDYYPYAENGHAIMSWLCRNKLRRAETTKDDFGTLSAELLRKGLYTVANLEEAFEDLRDSELLTPPPKEIEDEPAPARTPVRPVPAETSPRIVSTRRQPRGGLGIRATTTTVGNQLEEPRAPSAAELENLSDTEIRELLAQTRTLARSTRR